MYVPAALFCTWLNLGFYDLVEQIEREMLTFYLVLGMPYVVKHLLSWPIKASSSSSAIN